MIEVQGIELVDMAEACDYLKERYKDKPWDIWLEKHSVCYYIFIEDIYNSTKQTILTNLVEVMNFINKNQKD